MIASLVSVAFGILADLRLSRSAQDAPTRDWLGLCAAYEHGLIRPVHGLFGFVACVDDGVIDLIPRGVARLAQEISDVFARADDDVIDGLGPGAADRA
ncbi:hypothetical protein ILP92_01850 [Maribius pontilimi]|uniref:Uncharacterized protein n=1 Tax=Palleronia pontilimi TaxID=1964209 RepID=A0A934IF72_9RHOB|nr:hypothetical protein [Palleronia pontilimi]MBJ3761495.1 hypothetical protein [Palleronia pontilimi]